jgi:hypothetical protein
MGVVSSNELFWSNTANPTITVMQRPWPLIKAKGFILVSESLPVIISACSKAVK